MRAKVRPIHATREVSCVLACHKDTNATSISGGSAGRPSAVTSQSLGGGENSRAWRQAKVSKGTLGHRGPTAKQRPMTRAPLSKSLKEGGAIAGGQQAARIDSVLAKHQALSAQTPRAKAPAPPQSGSLPRPRSHSAGPASARRRKLEKPGPGPGDWRTSGGLKQ